MNRASVRSLSGFGLGSVWSLRRAVEDLAVGTIVSGVDVQRKWKLKDLCCIFEHDGTTYKARAEPKELYAPVVNAWWTLRGRVRDDNSLVYRKDFARRLHYLFALDIRTVDGGLVVTANGSTKGTTMEILIPDIAKCIVRCERAVPAGAQSEPSPSASEDGKGRQAEVDMRKFRNRRRWEPIQAPAGAAEWGTPANKAKARKRRR